MTLDLKFDQNSKPGIQLLIMCPRTGGTKHRYSPVLCIYYETIFFIVLPQIWQPNSACMCTQMY